MVDADTDMAAEVWNGTLQSIRSEQVGHDPQSRTEHWRVDIVARFGEATLEYLLRRDARGEIEDACPLQNQFGSPPDFLWQELPDVGSKGLEAGHWVVNETLVARQLVELEENAEAQGGVYVYDDHLKNQYEMLFCALGGYPWTVVHDNKRWGFGDEAGWAAAVEELSTLRQRLSFSEPTP